MLTFVEQCKFSTLWLINTEHVSFESLTFSFRWYIYVLSHHSDTMTQLANLIMNFLNLIQSIIDITNCTCNTKI